MLLETTMRVTFLLAATGLMGCIAFVGCSSADTGTFSDPSSGDDAAATEGDTDMSTDSGNADDASTEDSSINAEDTGTASTDTGTATKDTGTATTDGGTTKDTGTPKDTGTADTGGGTTPDAGGSTLDEARVHCVDVINKYRDTLGLAHYSGWTSAGTCADGQAKTDSEVNKAHSAFGKCGEWAQNECPGWPGPPDALLDGCLKSMWNEGPGTDFSKHGHYINMSSTKYTSVACGFYQTPGGSWWAVQDFK